MIIATAGHVDHGKTTLVHALTGVATDRLAEEQRRGLSIELGFAYVPMDGRRIGFVDVPGHEKFLRNMLAGVSAIDAALLVVAADDGVMPQTREHLQILHLLGIPTGVTVLTRTDLATAERLAATCAEVAALTAETFLAHQPIVPVSALQGTGMDALRSAVRALPARPRADASQRLARFTVDRSFTLRGAGLTTTGTVIDGSVQVGERLVVATTGREVRIRGIHTMGEAGDQALAGQRCALNLSGAGRADIPRGSWLLDPRNHATTGRVDGLYHGLAGTGFDPRRSRDRRVHAHAGASHTTGRLILLDEDEYDQATAPPLVQVVLDQPLPLRYGDRLVLREAADRVTMGALETLDIAPPARGRQRPARLADLRTLADQPHLTALGSMAAARQQPLDLGAILTCRGLTRQSLPADVAAELVCWTHRGGQYALHEQQFNTLRGAVVSAIDGWHQASPQSNGMRLQQLQPVLQPVLPRVPHGLLEALLDSCVDAGELQRVGGLVRRPGHRARLSGTDRDLWAKIEPVMAAGGRQPPVSREVAKATGIPHADLVRFLARIAPLGLTIKVAENRYVLPQTLDDLRAVLDAVAGAHPEGHITPISYRDATGIGRNLAISLLEHFDQRGITRRYGDYRLLTGWGEP